MRKKNSILKTTREQSGKTQSEVAKKVGILTEAYQKYEYGAGTKTIQTAIRIAKVLDTTVENLWGSSQTQRF